MILEQYQVTIVEIDENDLLSRFFGTLKHFNKGKPISNSIKEKMETFFLYKWTFDKN